MSVETKTMSIDEYKSLKPGDQIYLNNRPRLDNNFR